MEEVETSKVPLLRSWKLDPQSGVEMQYTSGSKREKHPYTNPNLIDNTQVRKSLQTPAFKNHSIKWSSNQLSTYHISQKSPIGITIFISVDKRGPCGNMVCCVQSDPLSNFPGVSLGLLPRRGPLPKVVRLPNKPVPPPIDHSLCTRHNTSPFQVSDVLKSYNYLFLLLIISYCFPIKSS